MVRESVNARRLADTDRDPIEGKCVFEFISKEVGVEMGVRKTYREANDLRALLMGREPVVSIDRIYLEDDEDEIFQGDIISFPDKPELPRFQIMDTQRDGLSRMVCRLNMIGSQV